MEELKFSILACVYGNDKQFANFLYTALRQDCSNYEVLIVDNAHPNDDIRNLCMRSKDIPEMGGRVDLRYFRIQPQDKKCKNIAQGINLAARNARGKYFVIVADPNVLLSFNLLKTIDGIDQKTVMLSDISGDLKISPTGAVIDEYSDGDPARMAEINDSLLKEMGWSDDPLKLKLIPGKHRMAPPHLTYDCYIVAVSRDNFLISGGYYETDTSWGRYHEFFVHRLKDFLNVEFIKGIKVIHQYHRVLKDDSF
jgi:glycosyltransferase involved in cell wall biosynthesis